jgi:hypothetical protein
MVATFSNDQINVQWKLTRIRAFEAVPHRLRDEQRYVRPSQVIDVRPLYRTLAFEMDGHSTGTPETLQIVRFTIQSATAKHGIGRMPTIRKPGN